MAKRNLSAEVLTRLAGKRLATAESLTGGGIGLLDRKHRHTVRRRCGAHDLQVGKTAAEIFDLNLHGLFRQAVRCNLLQIFFCEHSLCSFSVGGLKSRLGDKISSKLIKISNFAL